ncbi:MAG TPA: hypothetical protein VFT64_05755 [Rickettsiales bacterium]|nr:hypothetical protein [Rickettsiales bacterium]
MSNNQSQGGNRQGSNLSGAAEKMRSGNPRERSEGAQEMGQKGGQSHKNNNNSSGNR